MVRKKVLCLWIFSLAVVLGCSGAEPDAESGKVVHYYQFSLPQAEPAFQELRALFAQRYPEIEIQIHTLPQTTDDQHQFYLTHLTTPGASRIDVLAMDVIWLAEFARAGLLMPLGNSIDPKEWKEFFQSSVRAGTYKEERFGVPFFIDGGILYSRQDLLNKYGYTSPPKTFSQLIQMAQNILEKEKDPALRGFVWQGKQYEGLICNFLEFLPDSVQPFLVDGGSSFRFNQPAVKVTLQFMKDLVFKYRISPESVFSMAEEESRHVFHNGKAIFMRNWPYAWRLAQQEGSPIAGKVQVSLLPAFVDGEKGRSTLGGFLLGVNRQSPNPEAALAWVRFLSGKEAQTIIHEKLGLTPARKSILSASDNGGKIPGRVLLEVMKRTVPRPVTPVYNPISQSMQAYISGGMVGAYGIEQAAKRVESDARRIMRYLD